MRERYDDLPPMPRPPEPAGDFDSWLLLVASDAHPGNPAMLAARLGHAIDTYWDAHRADRPLAALDAIERAAATLATIEGLSDTPEARQLAEATRHSVLLLRLLHTAYLPHLRQRFAGIFIVGSMSYGRFSTVRGSGDARPSDLDLMLVAPDANLLRSDILLSGEVEDADEPARFDQYLHILETSPTDLLNYKLRGTTDGIGLSLTMCTLAGFANITRLEGGEDRRTSLHWSARFDGKANPLPDLGGAAYDARYWEARSGAGNVLTLPVAYHDERAGHRLGRASGFASMLAPRFDHVAMTAEVETLLLGFIRDMAKMAQTYELAGLAPHICNVHPRRGRMSRYFCAQMQQRFHDLSQQTSIPSAGI